MSDRRSFSEIPREALRDQGVDARVERIWGRLRDEVSHGRSRGPSRPLTVAFGLVAVAFASGVLVGGHLRGGPEVATGVASLGAEPTTRATPATAAPAAAPSAFGVRRGRPTARATPHGRSPRAAREEEVVSAPVAVAETLPAAPAVLAEWRKLADEGDYQGALSALEAVGGFEGPLGSASAEELMSLVDVARATGHRDRAIVVLRRIVSMHGADPNAPVAAWMLGNELAKVGDRGGAEQAFALYRALSPGGDFAEDALARQVDFAAEAGNVENARKLASQYLREFPDGPRRGEFQAQIDAWAEDQAAVETSPERGEAVGMGLPDGGATR